MLNNGGHSANSIPKKILIVEDELMLVRLLTDLFELEGYGVSSVSDGAQAVDAVKKIMPDLITLDIMLPNLNGFEICRLIKTDENLKHIPIIIISALMQKKDIETGMKMGADLYMTKPFDSRQLLDNVRNTLVKSSVPIAVRTL